MHRGPCRILQPSKGSGPLAHEDAFEGSEQSLPFCIARRAVTKDFAKRMNLALREQVAQSFLTLGTSLDFSDRQGSDHDEDRPRSHIEGKGSRGLHNLGCDAHVAAPRRSTSRCGWGMIPVRRRHHEGFSTAAQVSAPVRKSRGRCVFSICSSCGPATSPRVDSWPREPKCKSDVLLPDIGYL